MQNQRVMTMGDDEELAVEALRGTIDLLVQTARPEGIHILGSAPPA